MASDSRKALLQKLSKAKASGTGNHMRDGKYRWAIKQVRLEKGFKGERFQVDLVVMNAAKIQVISPLTNEVLNIEPDPVGRSVDWLQMLEGEDSPGPGNTRTFFLSLFNKREIDDDEYFETLAEMCDLDEEGKPLKEPLFLAKGKVIDGETLRIVTKKNKKEIVVVKWSHVEQSNEEQEQVAAWIDALATQQAQLTAGTQATA